MIVLLKGRLGVPGVDQRSTHNDQHDDNNDDKDSVNGVVGTVPNLNSFYFTFIFLTKSRFLLPPI